MSDAGSHATPLLSIAIPTFRRQKLLKEALASALGQDLEQQIEVVVIDNDPASTGAAADDITLNPDNRRLRYFVNAENIGMFGNWNRGIELARGEWFAILNDDDLLDPDFARRMLAVLTGRGAPDALICRKRMLDERAEGSFTGKEDALTALLRQAMFRGRRWRPITARHLFWGNVIGNSVGLVCRTADLRTIGGFDPDDYPSADYYVHARLATSYRLGQVSKVLASIRVAENESMKQETLYGFLRTGYRMQQALAGEYLPAWWRHISPPLIARHVNECSDAWVPVDRRAVERELGLRLPPDRPRLVKLMRLALGGL
ncbi:glycosyltransferase [Stakelama sp. CBK3Z-3]|uniref:Glycosyltransferase n=1 Tax=Stakelama flava TaxID=2860338 RepID=A0ABS6XKC6_9SPHN|nr:glycosyltransferase [Stakelama flava]